MNHNPNTISKLFTLGIELCTIGAKWFFPRSFIPLLRLYFFPGNALGVIVKTHLFYGIPCWYGHNSSPLVGHNHEDIRPELFRLQYNKSI